MINEELLKEGMTNIQFITETDIIDVNRITQIDKDKVHYIKLLPFSSEEISKEDGDEFSISQNAIKEIKRT